MSYDENYFERGAESGISLYSNYRWIPELTIPLAHEIIKICKIDETDTVLDFGCAKGFLVKAMKLLHINCYGYDPSTYAINQACSEVRDRVFFLKKDLEYSRFEHVISKDVFEHLDNQDLKEALNWIARKLTAYGKMFVVVPLGDGVKYTIESYDNDKTHIQRRSLEWWKDMIQQFGFKVDARYEWGHIKENWRKVHHKGNGFLLCEKV